MIDLWSGLSVGRRAKIISALQDTFAVGALLFFVGGAIFNHTYGLSRIFSMLTDILGVANLVFAIMLNIWGDILVYWSEDHD